MTAEERPRSEPGDTEPWRDLYEACRRAYDEDSARVEAIDRKANATLTLVALLLGAGAFKIDFIGKVFADRPWWVTASGLMMLATTTLLLFAAVYHCIRTLTIRQFGGHPDPGIILSNFEDRPLSSFYRSLAHNLRTAVEQNEKPMKCKIKAMESALWFTTPALVLSAILLLAVVCLSIAPQPSTR